MPTRTHRVGPVLGRVNAREAQLQVAHVVEAQVLLLLVAGQAGLDHLLVNGKEVLRSLRRKLLELHAQADSVETDHGRNGALVVHHSQRVAGRGEGPYGRILG